MMNIRFGGMVVGVLVSYASVLLPAEAIGVPPMFDLSGIGLVGAPIAGLLGWWMTPSVARAHWRWAAVAGLGVGVLAAVLGVWELSYLKALEALALGMRDGGSGLGIALFVGVIGLPFSVVAMPITIACGLAWALIVRGVFGRNSGAEDARGASLGIIHVAIVLGVIALGAALAPVAAGR